MPGLSNGLGSGKDAALPDEGWVIENGAIVTEFALDALRRCEK